MKISFKKKIQKTFSYEQIRVGEFFTGSRAVDNTLYQKLSEEQFLIYSDSGSSVFYYESCGEDFGKYLIIVDVDITVLE